MSFLVNDVFPAGIVLPYAGSTAPAGWLLCNTATPITIASYPRLYSAIGNTYNGGVTPGDGVTTFNLPNLSGVFPRGAGTQTISSVSYSGTRGTYQGDQMQGHYHSKSETAHTHAAVGETAARASGVNTGWGIQAGQTNAAPGVQGATSNVSITSPATDGSNGTPRTGTQTHPANVGVNYIIKI